MRGTAALAAVLLAVGLGGCGRVGSAPPPARVSGATEIPFALAGTGGAVIVVPVRINGTGPYQFVVDTGATFTCVDQTLATTLELERPVGMVGYGATLGGSGTMGLHRVDTINVGDVSASHMTVCSVDLRHMKEIDLKAEGLLGLNFLKAFTVTFDFSRMVMSLTPAK